MSDRPVGGEPPRLTHIDEAGTAELRARARENRGESSLTEWFAGRLPQASAPASVAGNSEFGLE